MSVSPSTIVAIGCSTSPRYATIIPITALLWQDLVGFSPRVFLVGDRQQWVATPYLNVILNALINHGITYRFTPRIDPWSEATVAQNIRQHAAADKSIDGNTWVSVADADLWPLQRDWYHQHESDGAIKCALYYVNGDHFSGKADVINAVDSGRAFQSIPTCHVVMRAKDWRNVYQYASPSPAASMGVTLNNWFNRLNKLRVVDDFDKWMVDQRVITWKLCQQPWFPEWRSDDKNCDRSWRVDDMLFVTRHGHPPLNRLDRSHRSDWHEFLKDRWLDAHVHESPLADENWPNLLKIIESVLPQHAAWAREYGNSLIKCL